MGKRLNGAFQKVSRGRNGASGVITLHIQTLSKPSNKLRQCVENEWEACDIAGSRMGGEASVHGGGSGGETKKTRAATVSEAIGSGSQRGERGRDVKWLRPQRQFCP